MMFYEKNAEKNTGSTTGCRAAADPATHHGALRRSRTECRRQKACWISFLDIEETLQDKSEQEFTQKLSSMYDNVAKYGMNTVIVHMRAMGDAMYPSDYYPWSASLSTDRSHPGYDPLQIMVNLAHQKNLQFEAWINPYRLSRDNKSTASFKATPFYEQFRLTQSSTERLAARPALPLTRHGKKQRI